MDTKAKAILILATLALSGCASDGSEYLSFSEKMRRLYTSNIEFYIPPRQAAINQFEDLVVLSHMNESPITLDIVERRLANAEVSGLPYFNEVTHEQPEDDQESAGVLTIEASPVSITTRSFRERRDQCMEDDTLRTCNGQEAFFTYVSCEGIYASISAEYKLETLSQDVIIPATQITKRVDSEACSDDSHSILTPKEMKEKAQRALGYKIAKLFTPRRIERPNDLITSLDVEDSSIKKSVKSLRKQASKGDLTTPLVSYIEISEQIPENPTLLFNIGYLYQATGNYEQAQLYYSKAQNYGFDDTDLLEKHLAEVNNWLSKGISQLSSSL